MGVDAAKLDVDLTGKTALVTGGGRGVGKATVQLLAAHGARVILTARHRDEIEAAAAEIRRAGADARAIVCDISDRDGVQALFAEAGIVDILINNASIITPIGPLADVDPEAWLYNVGVNLNGVFFACRRALPGMIERGWGRVVNLSSGAAKGTTFGWSPYAAAKAGVEALTRVLAIEVAGHDIRVNAVRPGIVDTGMQEEIRRSGEAEFGRDNVERFNRYHQQGMLRDPGDPAKLILWLLTPQAEHLNGEVLWIDDPEVSARIGLQPVAR